MNTKHNLPGFTAEAAVGAKGELTNSTPKEG